jgi:hypothetical protein
MVVVREAEAVEVWNANMEVSILYLHICSHLRAQLLIHSGYSASASLCGIGQ